MERLRAELTVHVGGAPSAAARVLIERAVWLSLAVARLDARMLSDGGLSDHASREYLAWSNSLTRTMRALGLEAAPDRPETIEDIMQRRRAQQPASAA